MRVAQTKPKLSEDGFISRDFVKGLGALACVGLAGYGIVASQLGYQDLPGFVDAEGSAEGRTKNALATVVAGLVAEKVSPESRFHFDVEKTWWVDSTVDGKTDNREIVSYTNTELSSSTFKAKVSPSGEIQGTVDKSEYDWNIKSEDANTFKIGRFLTKFDHTLQLNVRDGTISGSLTKTMSFDWPIAGSYTPDGKALIRISVPGGGDIQMSGTILGPGGESLKLK